MGTWIDGGSPCDPSENPPNYDKGKAAMCTVFGTRVCACMATSCTIDTSKLDTHFDLTLSGDTLTGSVLGLGVNFSAIYPIYLHRQP
jgi:hypothetical protein